VETLKDLTRAIGREISEESREVIDLCVIAGSHGPTLGLKSLP
jgi:hypothetical protein